MPFRKKPKSLFVKRTYIHRTPSVLRDVPFVSSMSGGLKAAKMRLKNRKLLKTIGIVAAFGIIGGIIGTAFVFAWVSRDLPDPNNLIVRQINKSTKIYDRTGDHLLYEIHGEEQRTLVRLDEISPYAKNATIASEDKNFYQHKGVQLQSFVRAVMQAALRGRRLEGTSTITQQVVKNVILSNERSLTRKLKEIILAYQIDKKFTKDEILQIYFNETPYGSTAYGIEAASHMYYGKKAADLDPAEAALLTALVPAPTRLSPYGSNTEELLWRQQHVLDTMHEQGFLTDEEYEEAKEVDILARVKPRSESIEAPHFVLWVKEQLAETYGVREVEQGGFKVITSIDFDLQKAAEESVTEGVETVQEFGGSNVSLVAIDPKTGHILAMVGSIDYFSDEIDGAVNVSLRNRQPGSSFKPLAYAEAIEKGYTPNTVVFDVNTSFPTDSGKAYQPKNYDLSESGPVTLKKALAGSLNIPAVKALYLAGVGDTIDLAERMGYSTFGDRSRFGLSLVLGGGEVKLLEHVAGYSVFANEGTYRAPASILKVEDSDGNILEEWEQKDTENILSVETARNINDMLSDNAARAYVFGERNYLTLSDRPVAAKTGTTNGFHDAWTMGYTPNVVAGVWVGNNNNTAMKSRADGSRVAAPIWQSFMKKAHEGLTPEGFVKPEPILTGKPVLDGQAGEIRVLVDKYSGKLATENTPPSAVEERVYRQAHSILHYVDKNDPRVATPTDPSSDPHYSAWEAAVADWAVRNNWVTTEPPPTEYDDIHQGEPGPTVTFELPSDSSAIATRVFTAKVNAFSTTKTVQRVEFYIDGALAGTAESSPWQTQVTVPSIYNKGFYKLKAVAYDEVDNWGSAEISINILTEGTPLSVSWTRPSTDITYRQRVFPIYIDLTLSDRLGVDLVEIVATPVEGDPITVGTLRKPKTSGVSATWSIAPIVEDYTLSAVIHLVNGETRTIGGPVVKVRE